MKKTLRVSGKVTRVGAKQAIKLGKQVMALQMPPSLTWIYSFGFKLGVFLILKSFLILRYQWTNLNWSGFTMVIAQFVQALYLIACGALMQNEKLYDEPLKLRKIANSYSGALLIGIVVFVCRETFAWQFFKEPKAINWFVDFFTGIWKGAGEIGLALLFWDFDLWSAFCGLLYFITNIYLHVSFDYEDGLWAKAFDKVHFLRESFHVQGSMDANMLEEDDENVQRDEENGVEK